MSHSTLNITWSLGFFRGIYTWLLPDERIYPDTSEVPVPVPCHALLGERFFHVVSWIVVRLLEGEREIVGCYASFKVSSFGIRDCMSAVNVYGVVNLFICSFVRSFAHSFIR